MASEDLATIETDLQAAITDAEARLRRARQDGDDSASATTEAELRTLWTSHTSIRLAQVPVDEQGSALAEMLRSAEAARGAVIRGAPGTDLDEAATDLKLELIREEALHAVQFAIDPDSRATARVEDLVDLATRINTNRSIRSGETNEEYDADLVLDGVRQNHYLAEVARIARGGVLRDADGNVLAGWDRQQAARFIEQFLLESMRDAANPDSFLHWHDPRNELVQQLTEQVHTTYLPLQLMGVRGGSMSDFHRAVALAIRTEATEVWQVYNDSYLGGGSNADSITARIITQGLGTSLRMLNAWFDGRAEVEQRLDFLVQDANIAADLFERFANHPDPATLTPSDQDAGLTFGFIHRNAAGVLEYVVPTGHSIVADQTRVDIPGGTVLDILSVANLATMFVSIVAPELAAARLVEMGARFGWSARTMGAVRLATELLVGAGLDAASHYALTPKQQQKALETVLLESLALGALGTASGHAIGRLFGNAATKVVEPMATLRLSSAGRSKAELLEGALNISADTIAQVAAQVAQGESVTIESVLSSMLSGALAREMGAGVHDAQVNSDALPDWFRGLDATVQRDALLRARTTQERIEAAVGALRASVGAEMTADAMFAAMQRGEFSFDQFRLLYGAGQLDADVALGVKVLRDQYFTALVPRVFTHVRAEIGDALAALDASIGDGPPTRAQADERADLELRLHRVEEGEIAFGQVTERDAEIAAHLAEHPDDKAGVKAIEAKWKALIDPRYLIVAPGSNSPGSDIDRSWPFEDWARVAAHLGELDAAATTQEFYGPTTARAFDVNEYNNPMLAIAAYAGELTDAQGIRVTVDLGDRTVEMSQQEVVTAHSYAAAMLNLGADQRATYIDRLQARLDGTVAGEKLDAQLDLAAGTLADLDAAIDGRVNELMALGHPDNPDTRLRAQRLVYSDRGLDLDDLRAEIDALPPGRKRLEKIAAWQRLLGPALIGGIETYTSIATLRLFVVLVQMSGKKVPALIDDPAFTILRDLQGQMTGADVDAILNDQVLMISHHIEMFLHGDENAQLAGRNLVKYGIRAVLGMHIGGLLDHTNPAHGGLIDVSKKLIAFKDDPDGLIAELAALGGGSTDAGVLLYINMLTANVPGLEGLFDPVALLTPGMLPPGARNNVRSATRTNAGASLGESLTAASAALGRIEVLVADVCPSDRAQASELLDQEARIRRMLDDVLPGANADARRMGETARRSYEALLKEQEAIRGQLQVLRNRKRETGCAGLDTDPQVLELNRRRVAALQAASVDRTSVDLPVPPPRGGNGSDRFATPAPVARPEPDSVGGPRVEDVEPMNVDGPVGSGQPGPPAPGGRRRKRRGAALVMVGGFAVSGTAFAMCDGPSDPPPSERAEEQTAPATDTDTGDPQPDTATGTGDPQQDADSDTDTDTDTGDPQRDTDSDTDTGDPQPDTEPEVDPPDRVVIEIPNGLRGLPLIGDLVPDRLVISVDENDDLVFSRSDASPAALPGTDIGATAAGSAEADESGALKTTDGSSFPCGAVTDEVRVTCQVGAGPMGPGEWLLVAMELDSLAPEIGVAYEYGIAFDSDGDESDNYQAPPTFDWDFFRGTEQWWRLAIDGDGVRRLWADGQVDGVPGVPRHTAAAALEFGDRLLWVIPRSELEGDDVRYRVSAFANGGEPGTVPSPETSAGDVLGPDPTAPLIAAPPATGDPLVLDQERWPDIDGTQPRLVPADGDLEQQFLRAAFAELGGRMDEALASGRGTDALLELLHPAFAASFTEEQCRATLDATLAQAERIDFDGPVTSSTGGFPSFQSNSMITYPTGTVPSPLAASVVGDGRFYLVLPCG